MIRMAYLMEITSISHHDVGAAAAVEYAMQFDEIARPAPGADVARAARQQPHVVDKNLRVSGVNGDPQVMVRIVSHPKPHIDVLIRIHRDDLSQGYEVRRRVHVRDQGVARET